MSPFDILSPAPQYFPIEKGIYELGPGLRSLGTDLGNGEMDKVVFQIAADFSRFRANKLKARQESFDKYIQKKDLSALAEKTVAQFILEHLLVNYPALFSLTKSDPQLLRCRLTEDQISFDSDYQLRAFKPAQNWGQDLLPRDLLDALLLQLPEDISILQKEGEQDWLAYLNLCSPSHWAAEDKIGLNFKAVHSPIPGIEKMLKASDNLTEAMIHKGPFVRFVWSFVTDTRLNHHPIAPAGEDPVQWKGRSFNKEATEPFQLRVERQTTTGFPEANASLFTIGLSFIPASEIQKNDLWRKNLKSALESMTPESKFYKGVSHCFHDLMDYLQ